MLEHDTVRRAVRTFVQAVLAELLVILPVGIAGALALDWRLALGAVAYAGAVALVSFLHNELEDAGRIRDTRHPRPKAPR